MIFPSTIMDEEEANADNSVEHYGDHGWKQSTRNRTFHLQAEEAWSSFL